MTQGRFDYKELIDKYRVSLFSTNGVNIGLGDSTFGIKSYVQLIVMNYSPFNRTYHVLPLRLVLNTTGAI